jgi:hypothetical protein
LRPPGQDSSARRGVAVNTFRHCRERERVVVHHVLEKFVMPPELLLPAVERLRFSLFAGQDFNPCAPALIDSIHSCSLISEIHRVLKELVGVRLRRIADDR